jgi:hypothetical protein
MLQRIVIAALFALCITGSTQIATTNHHPKVIIPPAIAHCDLTSASIQPTNNHGFPLSTVKFTDTGCGFGEAIMWPSLALDFIIWLLIAFTVLQLGSFGRQKQK